MSDAGKESDGSSKTGHEDDPGNPDEVDNPEGEVAGDERTSEAADAKKVSILIEKSTPSVTEGEVYAELPNAANTSKQNTGEVSIPVPPEMVPAQAVSEEPTPEGIVFAEAVTGEETAELRSAERSVPLPDLEPEESDNPSRREDYPDFDDDRLIARDFDDFAEPANESARIFAERVGSDDDETVSYEVDDEEGGEEEIIRDADLLISKPILSEKCDLPKNTLEFRYSFGYDCSKPYNLCVLDPDTIAFTAGNILHFCKVSTNTMTFRRSASGMGLGHVVKHPNLPHFAIGEKGIEPYIIILEWPSLTLVALLRHGTRESYSHLDYNPTGELLCSQGGNPDYLFTVWNWRKERILLRTRSANTDILNIRFSNYLPGHITTGGVGHIKFWKMSKTFTGLKLKGAVGRFGKTEVSDVMGFYAMPDEKVVSGCDWGNILVWEAGLIKFELTRKARARCHDAAITQFEFQNGELMTAGKDGFVKSWYFETIDLADPPDEDRFVEVDPMFELEVADHLGAASILSMARVNPTVDGDTSWYAQDDNGGIWLLNLAMTSNTLPPKRLLCCHTRQVEGADTSPISQHFISLDGAGRLLLWNLEESRLLAVKVMPFPGTSLIWLPEDVAPCGCVVLTGLSDGGVRALAVNLAGAEAHASRAPGAPFADPTSADLFSLFQFIKPHTASVLSMEINHTHRRLATAGADSTIFVFSIEPAGQLAILKPIGFIRTPSIATFLKWHPMKSEVFFAGCEKGQILEVTVPDKPTHNTDVSFEFTEALIRSFTCVSIKSQILRDIYLAEEEERKNARREEKMEALETLRRENPGLDIDPEQFLADSEPEEELRPLYHPPQPSPVLSVAIDQENTDSVWVLLGGYDNGYAYRYQFGKEGPVEWLPFIKTGMEEICCHLYNENGSVIFVGLSDGRICVGKVENDSSGNPANEFWSLGMHHGEIRMMKLTKDQQFLVSVGKDANIFSYKLNLPKELAPAPVSYASVRTAPTVPPTNDVYILDEPALEQASGKKEHDRRAKEATGKKQQVEHVLWQLAEQYNKLKRRNRALPKSQMISRKEMELDPRVTQDLANAIAEETQNLKRRYEYDLEKARLRYNKLVTLLVDSQAYDTIVVKAMREDTTVRTIRSNKIGPELDAARLALEQKLVEAQMKHRLSVVNSITEERAMEIDLALEEAEPTAAPPPAAVESFLRDVSQFEHKFTARLRRLLEKYQSRAARRERRKLEWQQFMLKKPDVNENDPEDEARIAEAERTVGDYKLKSGRDFKIPRHLIATTVSKYQELLDARVELDRVVNIFNDKVLALEGKKKKLLAKLQSQSEELKLVQHELRPDRPDLHKQPISMKPVDGDADAGAGDGDGNRTAHLRLKQAFIEEEEERLSPAGTKKMAESKSVAAAVLNRHDSFLKEDQDPMGEILFTSSITLESQADLLEIGERDEASQIDAADLDGVDTNLDPKALVSLANSDQVVTPYEEELKTKRLLRRRWEQTQLIRQMDQSVEDFDKEVKSLVEARMMAHRDATLIQLRIITMHQELIIIKACEAREDFLLSKVMERQHEKRAMMQQINNLQNRLDIKAKSIFQCQENEKKTIATFFDAVKNTTFKEYLRRIFKKKYKTARAAGESSSESSSSTSSGEEEEEEEAASIDSKDIQAVRFDENVCPPGCPPQLHELAFSLRAERHEAERETAELQAVSEVLKREHDSCHKKLKVIEDALQVNQNDLQLFQHEKQQRLNEVDTTVIMRLSQMRHVRADGTFIPMQDTLVFDAGVLGNLGKRVSQLKVEASGEHERHRKNRRHLFRMKDDLRFMEAKMKGLKENIVEAQYAKFGQLVSLDDLESALLRRFLYQLRLNVDDMKKDFDVLIKNIKQSVRESYAKLVKAVEANTDLQNLLLAITEERNKLFLQKEATRATLARTSAGMICEAEFQQDIALLRELVADLSHKRHELLEEVLRLRQKGETTTEAPGSPAPAAAAATAEPDVGQPGYHACCVPTRPKDYKQPPWPPRTLPGFGRLHECKIIETKERPPTPPKIADMWGTLMQEFGVDGQTFWPQHPDPSNKQKLSVETIGEGFVFKALSDLPAVHEEEVLAEKFRRSSDAPRLTVDGDDVRVVGGQNEEDSLADDAGRVESTEELFRRVPSFDVEKAIHQLAERLENAAPSSGAIPRQSPPRLGSPRSETSGVDVRLVSALEPAPDRVTPQQTQTPNSSQNSSKSESPAGASSRTSPTNRASFSPDKSLESSDEDK